VLGLKSANIASANVFPALNLELRAAVNGGRLDEARAKQTQLAKAVRAITQHGECHQTRATNSQFRFPPLVLYLSSPRPADV